MKDTRGPWYLLTGLAVGVVLGLLLAWLIAPVRYTDASPRYLDAESKEAYRVMVASAYAANRDLRRAQARIALLGDPDPVEALVSQAQDLAMRGGPLAQAESLANLALALDGLASTPGGP